MDDQKEKFEAWGLLELFGHQRLAGRLSEQTIGGCHFIRIDVPDVGEVPEYTRFFTQGAIYALTVTSEDVARKLADSFQARPIHAFELKAPERRLTPPPYSVDEQENEPQF